MLTNRQHFLSTSTDDTLKELARALEQDPDLQIDTWLDQPYKIPFTDKEKVWAKLLLSLNCGEWLMKDRSGMFLATCEPQWGANQWYVRGNYYDVTILKDVFVSMGMSDCCTLSYILGKGDK